MFCCGSVALSDFIHLANGYVDLSDPERLFFGSIGDAGDQFIDLGHLLNDLVQGFRHDAADRHALRGFRNGGFNFGGARPKKLEFGRRGLSLFWQKSS